MSIWMKRSWFVVSVAVLLAWPAPAVAEGPSIFVNSTDDVLDNTYCLPGQPCTLRTAIAKAQIARGVVRACYEVEGGTNGTNCPLGAKPLRTSDPNYEAATGRWVFYIKEGLSAFEISGRGMTIDFGRDVPGRTSAAGNRIVIDSGTKAIATAFLIQGEENRLMGFEVRGRFNVATIVIRTGVEDTPAARNQLGPGLVLANITEAVGIKMRGNQTYANKVVGTWCGLTGDGTVKAPVYDDCILIEESAFENVIGGPDPEDRNVLAASRLGVGVHIGSDTRGNVVQGNWIGLDAGGKVAQGNQGGVTVDQGAADTLIQGNVISGNKGPGISVVDRSMSTVIVTNTVGEAPDRAGCLGNAGYGISLQAGPSQSRIADNRVACNSTGGVLVSGSGSIENLVSRNSITQNHNHPLNVGKGANNGVAPPVLDQVTARGVRGTACKGCTVEIFSDPAGEADVFEGVAVASAVDGSFDYEQADRDFAHHFVAATASEGQNTSGLSAALAVGGPAPTRVATRTPTPTRRATAPAGPTATPGGPTATPPGPTSTPEAMPTQDPSGRTAIYLPWAGRQASLW